MSIHSNWAESLPALPDRYVKELFENFSEQVEAWYVQDWEKVGTKAGKICEIAFSAIDGIGAGTFASAPFKPNNFPQACQQLENKYVSMPRALRIQIPKVLAAVYELRNNRSIGHVGSVVQPNALDGQFFFRATKWIICELSRALCQANSKPGVEGFYDVVNASELPIIWEHGNLVRVLKTSLTAGQKVTVALAHKATWVDVEMLRSWVEYSNASDFRTKVLVGLHKKKLVEYDKVGKRVVILPGGMVEARKLH